MILFQGSFAINTESPRRNFYINHKKSCDEEGKYINFVINLCQWQQLDNGS